MTDFQSTDTNDQVGAPSPAVEPSAPSQSASQSSPPVSPVNATTFNEEQRWTEIQAELSSHDEALKMRLAPSDGQSGIASDSYQRRMREARQKLYDDFIKKSLDSHVAQHMSQSGGNKAQALQDVLKKDVLLTKQAGRDKVFRDDLVKEVEHRLDSLGSTPFQAAEEKLQALSSIYAHATQAGAEQGGVTDNWYKRILREARRRYALELASLPQEKLDQWTQKDSDFARYLKTLLVKENQAPAPVQGTSDSVRSTGEEVREPYVEQAPEPVPTPVSPQPSVEESMPPVTPGIAMRSEEEVAKAREEEERTSESTSESRVTSTSNPVPPQSSPSIETSKEEEPEAETAQPVISTVSTPQPPTESSTPSTLSEPSPTLGTVIPAPTQPDTEKEKEETVSPLSGSSSTQPMTPPTQSSQPETSPSSPSQTSSAPGQSFTDFLTSRSSQNEPSENAQPETPVSPLSPPTRPSQPETPAIQSQSMEQPANPSPFSPSPETSSIPPQAATDQSDEDTHQPEKKKGFLSRLFGK